MILCGDVGGTRTRLGLAEEENGRPVLKQWKEYSSKDWPDFYSLLDDYLNGRKETIIRACVGAAGPVKNGRCDVTHLPWVIESGVLTERVEGPVFLINDLAAMAASILFLDEKDTFCLQEGDANASGRKAILAAGTGLGQALLIPRGDRFQIMDTEGGQCDFAPSDNLEIELLKYLKHLSGHVSIEHVLSGLGIENTFQFLVKKENADLPVDLKQEMESQAPARTIIEWGLSGRFGPCVNAVQLFTRVYGAVAGNLALQFLAQGGIWLGGGLAPRLIEHLKSGEFLKVFQNKGQFSDWMRSIPVRVILNQQASLIGAAGYALGTRFDNSDR